MKIANISETGNRLGALIDGLKAAGSPVLIVDRGRPVDCREPVTGSVSDTADGRLSRLLRDGNVRSRRSDPAQAVFRGQPPRVRAGPARVDALLRERRERR